MCTKKYPIILVLLVFSIGILFSEEIVIGGDEGWDGVSMFNTVLTEEAGLTSLQLADSEYDSEIETEMLFHFNKGIWDSSGHHTLKQNNGVQISPANKKKGSGSAVFTGDGQFFELDPSDSSAFAAGSSRLNDFSIEFWLNPARLSEGENIIQWTGAVSTGKNTFQQEILCGISGRNLFWEFNNIFLTPQLRGTFFRLSSSRSLIPKRWHHHMVRYDSSTGLLEYLIDGIPEDIVYTTDIRQEEAEIYSPLIGSAKPSRFLIGRGYTGFIDELRITNQFSSPELNKYSMNSGTVVSDIIDIKNHDSRFYKIDSEFNKEGKTQIYYFYRISNKYFSPNSEYPSWKQIETGEMLSPDVKGRYLQVMAELFPDGSGLVSPKLYKMSMSFERNLPPLPPLYISAEAGNESVIISWTPVTEHDIAGYKLYYGDKPGFYFGSGSASGPSPIDVGDRTSIEINGLINGKLYYFAVTSYDNAELPQESVFSREISARPSAINRD